MFVPFDFRCLHVGQSKVSTSITISPKEDNFHLCLAVAPVCLTQTVHEAAIARMLRDFI